MIWGYHYFRKPPYRKHHSPNKGRITRIHQQILTEAHRMMTRKKTGVMDLLTVSTKTEIRGTRSPEIRNRALSSLADHPISSLSLRANCCLCTSSRKEVGVRHLKIKHSKKNWPCIEACPYLKKTTRHWDIEPNQQRGRPSWSNWLTRSCSRLLLLLQTWQYPIPRHPPNPQKLTDHELVTGPEEGVWGGVLRNTNDLESPRHRSILPWCDTLQKEISLEQENWNAGRKTIQLGLFRSVVGQIRTSFLRQASFASSLVKLEATLWW